MARQTTGKTGIDTVDEVGADIDSFASDDGPTFPANENRLRQPIGVPEFVYSYDEDGKVTQRTPWGVTLTDDFDGSEHFIRPRYYEDDEWELFTGLSPETTAALQGRLVSAGLINGEYCIGTWDEQTADAMRSVLTYANRRGIEWRQALDEYERSGEMFKAMNPKKGGSGRVFVARLSNAEDVKKVFRQTAYNVLGGKGFVDGGQEEAFVNAFHTHELNAQRAAFNAAGGGGTVEDAQDPKSFAEDQVEALDPAGAKAKRFSDYAEAFTRMLEGG